MIKAGICISYKCEILQGLHKSDHTYKMALYNGYAELSPKTKAYSNQGEVQGYGTNYESGGQALTGFKVKLDGDYAILTFDFPVQWPQANITACAALIYNDSLSDKNAVAVIDFGQAVTSLNDSFGVFLDESPLIKIS